MHVIEYSKVLEKKKRTSNSFFLFRDEMRKKVQGNIKMTELSNNASEKWKIMLDDEKAHWEKLYEINREITTDKKVPETATDQNLPASDAYHGYGYLVNEPISSEETSETSYLCGCFLGLDCFYIAVDSPAYDSSDNLNNNCSSSVLKYDCYLTESLEVNDPADTIEELGVEDVDNYYNQDHNYSNPAGEDDQ